MSLSDCMPRGLPRGPALSGCSDCSTFSGEQSTEECVAFWRQSLAVPDLDFVMPLKAVGLVSQAVTESVFYHYMPRCLYIISSGDEIEILKDITGTWDVPKGSIVYVEEETFFVERFGMKKSSFEQFYFKRDASKGREFGWWWQQLLKLGAAQVIPGLSENFYVWDGDLIVLDPWPLALKGRDGTTRYHIAILQEAARSKFNAEEYASSVLRILGMRPISPPGQGTFVAHHMVFNRAAMDQLISHMDQMLPGKDPWPAKLLATSKHQYRMSEYMLYSTWVLHLKEQGQTIPFAWHDYAAYGQSGIRQREPEAFLEALAADHGKTPSGTGYSFQDIITFLNRSTLGVAEKLPSHLQLEHVYGLRGS